MFYFVPPDNKGDSFTLLSENLSLTFYSRVIGVLFLGQVDFVDLNKRLPMEAGVVHPQAIIIFPGSIHDLSVESRPSLVLETGRSALPT